MQLIVGAKGTDGGGTKKILVGFIALLKVPQTLG
jgi:hypothetical protein